jgi:hypothetical protein
MHRFIPKQGFLSSSVILAQMGEMMTYARDQKLENWRMNFHLLKLSIIGIQ